MKEINNNYLIESLDENTNYEIRKCSFFNNIFGEWSETESIKITEFSVYYQDVKEKMNL